jgi:hypothetical protein
MIASVIAALLLGPALGDFTHDSDLRHLQTLPRDVRVHIDRQRNCNHWGGEEAYDAARAREIDAAERRLKCGTLEREERRLRRRYATSPAILKALRDNRDILS